MKPYWRSTDGGLVLYHGDFRETLPRLSYESVDLVLTDPPYGVNYRSRSRTLALTEIEGDHNVDAAMECIRLSLRVLRDHRHLYAFGLYDLSDLPVGGVSELIWDKEHFASGNCDLPWGNSHEYIQFAVKVRRPVNAARGDGNGAAKMRKGSVLRCARFNASGVKHHPTEKPVRILREMIESSSKIGETVLDPCAGSGSTMVAAYLEGRGAIGIELEEQHCETAVRRLEKAQRSLFSELEDL